MLYPDRAIVLLTILLPSTTAAQVPGKTSLTDPRVQFTAAPHHFVTLTRGDITAILADNHAVDTPELPHHRAGYNGVASLSHRKQPQNLFVPDYAGLNLEHIHDGTTAGLVEKYEPRKFPMELRIVSDNTVELYQPPTGNWKLESCGRYTLLEDGTIEYAFECIPRANRYQRNFIGLFWASYIDQPEDMAIFFKGRIAGTADAPSRIKAVTPKHGTDSTHRPAGVAHLPPLDDDFPLTLVNHPSEYEYVEPWYYGVSHGMAFALMFRARDNIWFAQSPSGGGSGNPAWDFQWFIEKPQVGQAYGFVMRASYLPFQSREQLEAATRIHRRQLQQ